MDRISNLGKQAIQTVKQGKETLGKRLGQLNSRSVSLKDTSKVQPPGWNLRQKASALQTSIQTSFPKLHLREAIVGKKEVKFPDFVANPEDQLSQKSPLEVLALPLPKNQEDFAKRIAYLEGKLKTMEPNAPELPILKTELEQLKFLRDQGPLSSKAHIQLLGMKQEAANLVLHRLAEHKLSLVPSFATSQREDRALGEAYKQRIDQAQTAINTYFRNKAQHYIETLAMPLEADPPSYKILQNDLKTIQGDIAQILMEHQLHTPGTRLEDLIHTLEHTHNKIILNTQAWDTIEQDIYCYHHNGEAQKFTSTLTPALQLGAGLDYQDLSLNDVKSTAVKRQEGTVDLEGRKVGGLSSEMQHSKHAVNLWKSDLHIEGKDGQRKLLGSVFRHGVLTAYQDSNDLGRKEKNLNRAKEVVTAMVHTSLKDKIASLKDGDTLEVPIVATNLQSASDTVAFVKRFLKPGKNEKAHVKEHIQAWEDLKKAGPFELTIDGKTIKIQPQPITFNFGVNILSVGKASKLASTWRSVKAANQKGMEALLGQNYLAGPKEAIDDLNPSLLLPEKDEHGNDNGENIRKNKAIRALAQDIHAIYNSKTYQTQGVDPYKLVARINALAILAGRQASINCKSGKDRTSVCDAEIKHLLSHIELRQGEEPILPSYEKPLEGPERKNYQNFIFAKANFAVQEKNTGIAGYKCDGVPALFAKVTEGSSYLKDLFLGGSMCVKV